MYRPPPADDHVPTKYVKECLLPASCVPRWLVVARAARSVEPVRAESSVPAEPLPLYGSGVMVTACRHPQTKRRTAAHCKGSSGVELVHCTVESEFKDVVVCSSCGQNN
jgi:hypothetical protein